MRFGFRCRESQRKVEELVQTKLLHHTQTPRSAIERAEAVVTPQEGMARQRKPFLFFGDA